jgi:MFS family permease
VRELLRKPVIARLGLVHSASFAFSVVSGNWVVTLVRRHLDLGYGAAGAVGGLTLLLGIVGRPFGGWLARRYPQHRYPLLVTALLVAAAGTALLGLSTSVAAAVAGAALLGFACGVPFGACVNAAAASAPNAPGEAVGAMNLYAVTTVIVATPLVGATFGLSGGGRIGFLAVAVLTALAATAVPRR